jgi:SOS response regulatory protein OraA/RecX
MEQESYSSYEVIVALQNAGISQEIVEYVVPILGYESRVDGTLFVNTAEDELSPSYGLAQANVSSMSPAIYMAFKELGVELPGLTDEQEEQLLTNKYIDDDLRPFTEEQTSFVINWFQNTAKLNDHAVVLKYMIQQKMMEGAKTEVEAINELYPLTVSKFNDTSNQDAQAVKSQISGEVSSFYNEPDRGIPVPEEGFDPSPIQEDTTETTTTTIKKGEDLPGKAPTMPSQETQRVDTSSDYMSQVPKQAGTYEETQYMTRMRRLNPNFRKDQFLKNFDNVTRFKKKDPTQFRTRPVVEEDEIKFPFGTPVTSQEVLDLLE